MAYNIRHTTNTKPPITIQEGESDSTSTDLVLFGRVDLEYGQDLDTDMLALLEHFACPQNALSVPDNTYPDYTINGNALMHPTLGQLWYNGTVAKMFSWNGTNWAPIRNHGDVAGNWGQISDGGQIPRPVNPYTGYVYQYSECIWSVAPANLPIAFTYMNCTTDTNAVVNMKYRAYGDNQFTSALANYMIIAIAGNVNNGSWDIAPPVPDSSATPTPTPTLSVTPTISLTVSVTPTLTATASPQATATPTPTPAESLALSRTPAASNTPYPTTTPSITPSVTPFTPITHTYTVGTSAIETAPAGTKHVTIAVWGSGGSGGYGTTSDGENVFGGGGGSGAYSQSSYAINGGDTLTYSVGSLGTADAVGTASIVSSGSLSIATITANSGFPGQNTSTTNLGSAGGSGGVSSGGTSLNTSGNTGIDGQAGTQPGVGGSAIVGLNSYNAGSGGHGGLGPSVSHQGSVGAVIFYYI
jgi:hypothetical protein